VSDSDVATTLMIETSKEQRTWTTASQTNLHGPTQISQASTTRRRGRLLSRPALRFIENPAAGLDLELDIYGTPFQRRVWDALCGIPAGRTVTYAALASRIGEPGSARAVANACAANAIALAIPCHRVIRSDGTLSGYRWGVERKRALLAREAQA
jgi:O-6-methylguanine DNA methyltransferase